MDYLKKLFPEDLYHSYIVEGNPEVVSFDLKNFLEARGEISIGSADLLFQTYNSFTVDDSHQIKEWHSQMRINDKKRICIIGAKFINHDAERTLLKMIEEPNIGTHFFIVVPNASVLLDTIRSRSHVVSTFDVFDKGNIFIKLAEEFLLLTPEHRIDFVAKIIKERKNEENNSNLRFIAIGIINEIEKNVFNKLKKTPNNNDLIFIIEELAKNRDFLNNPGSSVKIILENIALLLD